MRRHLVSLCCLTGILAGWAMLVPPAAGQPVPSERTKPQPTTGPAARLPAGPLKLVALGDSLTAGDGDEAGKGYPGRLIKLIQAARPNSEVANLGKSGWTSENVIKGQDGQQAQLAQALAARPHVALVWIGSNDQWNLYEYGNPSGTTADDERDDLQNYRRNVETIIKGLKENGAMVFIGLLDDQSKRPVATKGKAFTGITKAELAQMSKHVAAYNAVLKEIAARHGSATVDFNNTTLFTDAATLSDDGNHPNDKGYDAIAQLWFKAIEPRLKR